MKVNITKENYAPRTMGAQSNNPVNRTNSYNPQFTGAMKLDERITDLLPDKKTIKFMEKMKWLKGEAGGILITAIGTGAVAPIFIAFNPFVKAPKDATPEQKEDVKNTKQYTAWRQPISAVLSIIFQLSILKQIDKGLEAIFNNPEYAKNLWLALDQSELNKKSFIEKQIKKELKQAGKNVSKEEFDSLVKAREEEQLLKISEGLEKNGSIRIGERVVQTPTTAEILNDQIKSYIKDAENLKTNPKKMDFYKKRATDLVNNEEEFRRILSKVPKNEADLTRYLEEQIANTEHKDVEAILKEILNFPDKNLRSSRCERTIDRIDKIKKICNGEFTPEKYYQSMLDDNATLDKMISGLKSCKIKNPSAANEQDIISTAKKVAENCKYDNSSYRLESKFSNIDTFGEDSGTLLKKIYRDVTKGYKKVVEKRYKGFNQISKIAIGLCITLPITCTALNWVYPRFMELCFPKLAGTKKDNNNNVKKNGGEN